MYKSLECYRRVLGLEAAIEFVEDGVLRGVALRDADQTLMLALREPERAASLSGFDPVALTVPTLQALHAWSIIGRVRRSSLRRRRRQRGMADRRHRRPRRHRDPALHPAEAAATPTWPPNEPPTASSGTPRTGRPSPSWPACRPCGPT
ncbi:hypothetical protein ACQEVF_43960 [Nonomuraea polychroma]|uniref:hypothetical protein n=1 Tax=Nonomuraea polychroma TaxID=46176 RepID=UPI003D92C663